METYSKCPLEASLDTGKGYNANIVAGSIKTKHKRNEKKN